MNYRKTKSGSKVKYDSNPENDYQDGYNAGRRYGAKREPSVFLWGIAVGMAIELLLFIFIV